MASTRRRALSLSLSLYSLIYLILTAFIFTWRIDYTFNKLDVFNVFPFQLIISS